MNEFGHLHLQLADVQGQVRRDRAQRLPSWMIDAATFAAHMVVRVRALENDDEETCRAIRRTDEELKRLVDEEQRSKERVRRAEEAFWGQSGRPSSGHRHRRWYSGSYDNERYDCHPRQRHYSSESSDSRSSRESEGSYGGDDQNDPRQRGHGSYSRRYNENKAPRYVSADPSRRPNPSRNSPRPNLMGLHMERGRYAYVSWTMTRFSSGREECHRQDNRELRYAASSDGWSYSYLEQVSYSRGEYRTEKRAPGYASVPPSHRWREPNREAQNRSYRPQRGLNPEPSRPRDLPRRPNESFRTEEHRPGNPQESERSNNRPNSPRPQLRPPPRSTEQLVSQKDIEDWHKKVDACFKDYSKMTTFPSPPGNGCSKDDCINNKENRFLSACPCQVKQSFYGVPGLDSKKERVRWHPDRFAQCPPAKREEFQKLAKEVFVLVNAMV